MQIVSDLSLSISLHLLLWQPQAPSDKTAARIDACVSLLLVFVGGRLKTKAYMDATGGGKREEIIHQLWRKRVDTTIVEKCEKKSVRKCEEG